MWEFPSLLSGHRTTQHRLLFLLPKLRELSSINEKSFHMCVAETVFLPSTDLEGLLWSFLGLNTFIKYLLCTTSWALNQLGKTIGKEDTAPALAALVMCSVGGLRLQFLRMSLGFIYLLKCW